MSGRARGGTGLLITALAVSPAWAAMDMAASGTATFGVSMTVAAHCAVTASPLAFGVYTGLVKNATAILTIICTNTTNYDIGLDAGMAPGANVHARKMTNGANVLGYSLAMEVGQYINWGNTVGLDTLMIPGTGGAAALTVYGRLPAGQFVAPGAYGDTVTVTITW